MPRFSAPDPRLSMPLRRRLEQAARNLNPYLVLFAIGLAMLNLTGLVLRVPHLKFSWGPPAETCAPAHGPQVIVPGADAALRAGS
jgi:hypothetical protein